MGTVPWRVGGFQHRDLADELDRAMAEPGPSVRCHVVTGMGGTGKTQLAADHVGRAWAEGRIDLLVWVSAASRQAVVDAYARAARDVLGTDPGDPDAAARFLAWLEPGPAEGNGAAPGQRERGASGAAPDRPVRLRWLVVLDDVAEPAHLRGLWPPPSPVGRTLVTTRRRDAALVGPSSRVLTVGQFSPEEAVAYLTETIGAGGRHEDRADLGKLAADLGHLPLALSQAAAYLVNSGVSYAGYRRLLSDRSKVLADVLPEHQDLPDDQVATATAAWAVSLDRADSMRPAGLARPLLGLLSFMAPEGIPGVVVTAEPVLEHLASHGEASHTVTADDAVAALRVLHRLSLVEHNPEVPHQAVRVHQLIQRSVRDGLSAASRDRSTRRAADALSAVWPEIERDTDLTQSLRSNADALARLADEALWRPDAHPVLQKAADSLGESGRFVEAEEQFAQLVDSGERLLGADHPTTLELRGYLVKWRVASGEEVSAAEEAAALAGDRRRVLGAHHPDTLRSEVSLLQRRAQVEGPTLPARALRELLPELVETLGCDHEVTLFAMGLSALLSGATGDVLRALGEFEDLLEHQLGIRGPDDPTVLNTRCHILTLRWALGDTGEGDRKLRTLVEDSARVMGPGHVTTLLFRCLLPHWLEAAGDLPGAVAAWKPLVAEIATTLGHEHPYADQARYGMADAIGQAGDAVEAYRLLRELFDDMSRRQTADRLTMLRMRAVMVRWQVEEDAAAARNAAAELLEEMNEVLGGEHPDTLGVRSQLAELQGSSGDARAAAEAYADIREDSIRILGSGHAMTRRLWACGARWLGEAGDLLSALETARGLLAVQLRVLGADHRESLLTREWITIWRWEAGEPVAAVAEEAREVAADLARVLGPEHEETQAVWSVLALMEGSQDTPGAAARLADLLAEMSRHMGPDHPDVLSVKFLQGARRAATGDFAAALPLAREAVDGLLRAHGAGHPDLIEPLELLAYSLAAMDQEQEALETFIQVQEVQSRTLSPDHPDTLETRFFLTDLRRRTGDVRGAVSDLALLVDDMVHVLGGDHENTLGTRDVLLSWLIEAREAAQARDVAAESVAARTRALGAVHPDTLADRSTLALMTGEAGDHAGAVALWSRIVSDSARAFGPGHENTLGARAGLANWQRRAGYPALAASLHKQLAEDWERFHGPDHLEALGQRERWGASLTEAGEFSEARAVLAAALVDASRLLGADDAVTLACRHSLAYLLSTEGDLNGARTAWESLLADAQRALDVDHDLLDAVRENLEWCRRDTAP
ncbi:tetratricopeptide repeat protein [Streptomyces sp. NPDC056503]|uniref:tetratricopeptide repeat protein n=1 Tax=Streptomyces sp. NPDC056503 TaxID=3345842 RepID=UPI0036930B95